MKKKTIITRRSLLKKSALAAAGSTLFMNLPARVMGMEPSDKSRVILVRDRNAVNDKGKVDATVIQQMLDRAVTALLDEETPARAWSTLFFPSDIVGIKTNSWERLRTPPELETAIKRRVMDAGVPEQNISINDRGVLNDPVFKKATALINSRPSRTHAWAGLGTLLKNYITFSNNRPSFHPDSCADLGRLWEFPQVKGKTRLNILVVLTPLFHGVGPQHFNREYVWTYGGLLVGSDPVAVDTVGAQLIRAKRKQYFGKEIPINPPPKHIGIADLRYHLGTADLRRIELIKLGWKEDILI